MDRSEVHIRTAAKLASLALDELITAGSVCQSHGLFGEIKVLRDSLEPVEESLRIKREQLEDAAK